MMNKINRLARRVTALAVGISAGLAAILLTTACTVDSADTVIRTVNVDVTGIYRNAESNMNFGKLVSNNSGAPVSQLDLRQDGDQLQGIDNNFIVFKGEVNDAINSSASFYLEGKTTLGNAVVISGTIDIGNGKGVMRATWIEDTLFASVYGTADGPTIVSNIIVPPTNSISNAYYRVLSPISSDELAAYQKTVFWFCQG